VIRLGVVGHPGYEALPAVLSSLTAAAARFGIEPYFEKDLLPLVKNGRPLEKPASIDALLTLGGDGTLLRGARLIASHQVPILGINMGRLGFLTCCGVDQFVGALEHLSRKEYKVESRMGLIASIDRTTSGAVRESWIALNDVVVHKGGVARIASLRVGVNGELVATYSADGVVISTPTGSTAYSLSAGGPVVFPTLESILVTPVSPHTLAIRPLLVPAESEVTVQRDDGPAEIMVTVDGQVGTMLGLDETLRVHRAARPILIIRFPGSSFFATLRKKLGWGGLPERDETTG
jgi:NAD+ kinase